MQWWPPLSGFLGGAPVRRCYSLFRSGISVKKITRTGDHERLWPFRTRKIAVFSFCRDRGVHLSKQESPESTKLLVLFQPFLRFAEDIQQMVFSCLGRFLVFWESPSTNPTFFGGRWSALSTHENRYNQWLMARAIYQVKSHAIYFRDNFCMCHVQQWRQQKCHSSCPCFPTFPPPPHHYKKPTALRNRNAALVENAPAATLKQNWSETWEKRVRKGNGW